MISLILLTKSPLECTFIGTVARDNWWLPALILSKKTLGFLLFFDMNLEKYSDLAFLLVHLGRALDLEVRAWVLQVFFHSPSALQHILLKFKVDS